MNGALALIDRLALAPHPEGGWYRETWRAPATESGRSAGTAILFLLERGQGSHWHSVDADELWLWHDGAPVTLRIAADADTLPDVATLGPANPQVLVPAGQWQAAQAVENWALMSCVVVPGFDFAGFSLAPDDWEPGPQAA
jgi:predicted cupin superfamily sugar epimerase